MAQSARLCHVAILPHVTSCRNHGYLESILSNPAILAGIYGTGVCLGTGSNSCISATGGARINLWVRGPLVLLKAFIPRLFYRLQSENPKHGWRYALHVSEAHPQIGAKWAAQMGCSELTCWLIEHHQEDVRGRDGEQYALLLALQWADERN